MYEGQNTSFLALTGSLKFLSHGVLPQATFASSYLQQRICRLKVSDMMLAISVLRDVRNLSTEVLYLQLPNEDVEPRYLAFSDASPVKGSYCQTGYFSGLYPTEGGESAIYHVLDWPSCKHARISFSAMGAEFLAEALLVDRWEHMASCVKNLFGSKAPFPFVITVDSDRLHSTITTLHEGTDYRLRPTVSRLRDSFESGVINFSQWIPGAERLADALMKRSLVIFRKLNSVMKSGMLDLTTLINAKRASKEY